MDQAEVLKQVVAKAQSDLILFFVIVAVIVIAIAVPVTTLLTKKSQMRLDRQKQEDKSDAGKLDKWMQREAKIIEVISDNTKVLTKIGVVLERIDLTQQQYLDHCRQCRVDQTARFTEICNKQDRLLEIVTAQRSIHKEG